MTRIIYLLYGVGNYVLFLLVALYLVGFLLNIGVPQSMDAPIRMSLVPAVVIDILLLLVFGIQHSVMARPSFKLWWTKFVPKTIERSTYLLFSNLALILLFVLWQPFGPVFWDLQSVIGKTVAYGVFALGWGVILSSTFMINHFDLFGLRQVWLQFLGRPCEPLVFKEPGFYRWVRHPLYVGWAIVFWATPTMSAPHLLFALAMTAYMLIAIFFEERNLLEAHGDAYEDYRRRTPMMIPRLVPVSTKPSDGGPAAD